MARATDVRRGVAQQPPRLPDIRAPRPHPLAAGPRGLADRRPRAHRARVGRGAHRPEHPASEAHSPTVGTISEATEQSMGSECDAARRSLWGRDCLTTFQLAPPSCAVVGDDLLEHRGEARALMASPWRTATVRAVLFSWP